MIEILYADEKLVVCIKPAGVLSTDEDGGLPSLLRQQLGTPVFKTVHRLDRVVGGVMVLARTARCASDLSAQITAGEFSKSYLAVIHGAPMPQSGRMCDLLYRDKAKRKTMIVTEMGKDVRPAELEYKVISSTEDMSLVYIKLITGRTHQIRAQFSSRNMPLVGDKRYGIENDDCDIALWSERIAFTHPKTGEAMEFSAPPPERRPWTVFHRSME